MRLAAILALALPTSAFAQTSLTSADGYVYDLQTQDFGDMVNGTADSYDSWGELCLKTTLGFTSTCGTADVYRASGTPTITGGGRIATMRQWTHADSGVVVQREFFVPDSTHTSITGTGWVRMRERLYNPASDPITIMVRFGSVDSVGDLGSDSSTQVTGTSTGAPDLGAPMTWATTDDATLAGGDPSLVHVFSDVDAPFPVTRTFRNPPWAGVDAIGVEWEVTIPPDTEVSILHWESQQPDSTTAIALAQDLMTPAADDFFGMTPQDISLVANWSFGGGFGGPYSSFLGECPGEMDIAIGGITPGGRFALIRAPRGGRETIPAGPCAGTEIGLFQPDVLGIFRADQDGKRNWEAVRIGTQTCQDQFGGGFVQVIDLISCDVGRPFFVPFTAP